jgi:hypothetical protein
VRLEGLGQLKNPVTSSGIEPALFRLVVQCLNQKLYRVPASFCTYSFLNGDFTLSFSSGIEHANQFSEQSPRIHRNRESPPPGNRQSAVRMITQEQK